MIIWEKIVNRYVMSIFGKEALSEFEKGTPVSHVLEGKFSRIFPASVLSAFDTPTRF